MAVATRVRTARTATDNVATVKALLSQISVRVWVARNDSAVRRAAQTLTEIWESNAFNVATLSVAVRAIRTLAAASGLPA